MKRNIYKCEVIQNDDGTIKVTSYANRQIHYGVLAELNKAVHEAADKLNGKAPWRKKYIRFEHDGKTYQQTERKGKSNMCCEGCCFHKGKDCKHPYYGEGTDYSKGSCDNMIYRRVK